MAFPIPDNSRKFDPAPAGLHEAVLVDIIDLGEVVEEYDGETTFKHKMKLVWQLKARNMKINERFQARATYTVSLGENSNFRKMLRSWRGRDFTPEELAEFRKDIEKKLLGANCRLNLSIAKGRASGREYAKVEAVMPPDKGQALKAEAYEREVPKTKPAPVAPPNSEVYDVDPIDEGIAAAFDETPF